MREFNLSTGEENPTFPTGKPTPSSRACRAAQLGHGFGTAPLCCPPATWMDGCFCQAGCPHPRLPGRSCRQGQEPAPLPQHLSRQKAARRPAENNNFPRAGKQGISGAIPAAGASPTRWGLLWISSGRRASPAGRGCFPFSTPWHLHRSAETSPIGQGALSAGDQRKHLLGLDLSSVRRPQGNALCFFLSATRLVLAGLLDPTVQRDGSVLSPGPGGAPAAKNAQEGLPRMACKRGPWINTT